MSETANTTHTGGLKKVLGVIGALAAITSAVVAALVYLQSRPSRVDEFHHQVDALCKTASSRQAPLILTVNELGQYDRQRLIAAVRQDVDAARANLEDLRHLGVPSELQAQHSVVVESFQHVLDSGSQYAASLPALPKSEYAKHFPDLPGDAGDYNAAATRAQAGVVALSGGLCQSAS